MGQVRRPTFTVKVTDPETGEARTERRQSKTWWVRYYRNGKRHEESSGSTKKGDAERLLKLREAAVVRGEPVTAQAGRLRFDDAVKDVVSDYKVNGKPTLKDVETRVKLHLEPFFGGRRMTSITAADVRAYSEQRQEAGAANATINRELAILKRSFRLAVKAGKLHFRPDIPMLRENNVRKGFFEADEFEDVRSHLPAHLQGVATFAYFTGWRTPSEILPLEWSQVDRKAQVIRLEPGTTKNDDGRTLPYGLLPELVEVVEGQWAEHQRLASEGTLCPFVFPSPRGKRVGSFRKSWQSACKAAGVHGKIPHDFRRTAVRNLVRAGVPEKVAMEVTGHKTRSVFDRYNIVSERDLRDAMGKLASTAAGKEKGKKANSGRVAPFVSR